MTDQATADSLKWTALRHRMLREVASGSPRVVTGWPSGPRPTFRGDVRATAYEARAIRSLHVADLVDAYVHDHNFSDERTFRATDAGLFLLSRWDAEHPAEPATNEVINKERGKEA